MHCVDIWNWRYLDFYQGPMTVYLHLYSTNFVSQFLLWSSIRTCLQSSHYEDNHYIFLCCECQSLSMPNKACTKAQSFLVFGLFFYWFLNYTRGRAFRREISNIHTVGRYDRTNLVVTNTAFHVTIGLLKACDRQSKLQCLGFLVGRFSAPNEEMSLLRTERLCVRHTVCCLKQIKVRRFSRCYKVSWHAIT